MRVPFRAALALLLLGLASVGMAQATQHATWQRVVFGLDLSFRYPARFATRIEAPNTQSFRETLLLPGETLLTWRESIGVEAFDHFRKMASLYGPERMLVDVERVFHKTCEGRVDALPLPSDGLGVLRAAARVFRCTPRTTTEPMETILHLALLGKGGIYMIVWGERATRDADAPPPAIDTALWTSRLRGLGPVRLCEPGQGARCF